MANMNEYIGDNGALYDFCVENDLVDTVALLNPLYRERPYLHDWRKRIDYIFTTQALAGVALKGGHHQFHQHVISDHKGLYLHFNVRDLFDSNTCDTSHASYRKLWMGRRDIVKKYIACLEKLYRDHRILERAETIVQNIQQAGDEAKVRIEFEKLDKLDAERVQYMISAENYAGKPPPNGIYAWSPSLEKTGCTITYWKMRLYGVHGGVTDLDRISRLKVDLQIHDTGVGDKVYIKMQLSKAWQDLRKV